MKIVDMHIHIMRNEANPEGILKQMEESGIWGGCLMSRPSLEYSATLGADFESRLNEVMEACAYAPDRLFPIMWVHPYEDNILEKVKIAADRGVCGFKIICNNFFVYEEKCMEMLRRIASLNKPVMFHSGILWDGEVSSKYNHPSNFEALLKIEGLRFSMGHCSWPWVDDCVALYGKFMNAYNFSNKNAEMFFDMTPGTPEIYREDLLRKLFTLGYDVENNIMFGTDSHADVYVTDWAKQWLSIDGKLMDRFGVSKMVQEKMYYSNVMRFLGITNEQITHNAPTSDNANKWSCENPEVRTIIRKWYDKLGFCKAYNDEFVLALARTPISDAIFVQTYSKVEPDGKRNFLSYLFMCEELSRRYAEKGISEKILLDTLSDLRIWLDTWSDLKGELYLGETAWLGRHLNMEIFRLGRLQFAFEECECDCPEYGIRKGEKVIAVHIPADGALTPAECDASFAQARKFFAEYFPEYEYRYFTCHSWLLDPVLKEIMDENANIIQFQNRFTCVKNDPSYAILRYVFKWNTNPGTLKYAPALTSFAATVKKQFQAGKQFHETLGIIAK